MKYIKKFLGDVLDGYITIWWWLREQDHLFFLCLGCTALIYVLLLLGGG